MDHFCDDGSEFFDLGLPPLNRDDTKRQERKDADCEAALGCPEWQRFDTPWELPS
jgi:hypothetical protein